MSMVISQAFSSQTEEQNMKLGKNWKGWIWRKLEKNIWFLQKNNFQFKVLPLKIQIKSKSKKNTMIALQEKINLVWSTIIQNKMILNKTISQTRSCLQIKLKIRIILQKMKILMSKMKQKLKKTKLIKSLIPAIKHPTNLIQLNPNLKIKVNPKKILQTKQCQSQTKLNNRTNQIRKTISLLGIKVRLKIISLDCKKKM